MKLKLTLYTREDCCLCHEMKAVIGEFAERTPVDLEEIDVDSDAELQRRFGDEVPVLYIDGRKAFKYRVTVKELAKRIGGTERWWRSWLSRSIS